jgi:hypothetical protein
MHSHQAKIVRLQDPPSMRRIPSEVWKDDAWVDLDDLP